MTTINTMQDLTRLLRENPEWRDEIRRELLTEELLELPQRFAEYAKVTDRRLDIIERKVDTLTDNLNTLTGRVDALTDNVNVLTGRVDTLTENVNALTGRVDALTENLNALTERVDRLTENVNALTHNVIALTGKVDTLGYRVDSLRGYALEQRLPRQLPPLASREFDVRRVYSIWPPGTFATNQRTQAFEEMLEQAAEEGVITDDDETRLRVTDLIMRSQRKADMSTLWFVVEASGVINYEDITRVKRSADAIASIYGQDAAPIVYGYHIQDEQKELARQLEVTVFLDPDAE